MWCLLGSMVYGSFWLGLISFGLSLALNFIVFVILVNLVCWWIEFMNELSVFCFFVGLKVNGNFVLFGIFGMKWCVFIFKVVDITISWSVERMFMKAIWLLV